MRAQLPSVQLDAVAESSDVVVVANRNPQPGELQIPLEALVRFDLFGMWSPTDLLGLELDVDSVAVLRDGDYLAGWQGSTQPLPGGVPGHRFVLVPPQPFDFNETVHVELRDGAEELAIWAFTTLDVAPPVALNVTAINANQLRVVFSEPVTMGTPGALVLGDALAPESYSIEYRSRPAVTPTVVAADYVSSTEITLTTDLEPSFGAQYTLVISGVSDEFGNTFVAPNNVCEFTGYTPPYPAGRRWLLHDMVPRVALSLDDGTLRLFLGCLQDTNNILLHSIDRWIHIIDPDTAPEDFVDAMLMDLGNPFEFPLTLALKRRLAKVLVLIYRLKGTVPGIIAVIRFFLGIEVSVETFVGRGWILGHHQLSTTRQVATNPVIVGPNQHALYCFRVRSLQVLTDEQKEYIRTIAIYMKGTQEHFVGIRDGVVSPTDPYWWTVGVTKVGRAHLYGYATPPEPPLPQILSFTLAEPPPF